MPPEFIGVGQLLSELTPAERALLLKYYPQLPNDLTRAGKFFSPANAVTLSKHTAWQHVNESVAAAAEILKIHIGPRTMSERLHANHAAELLLVKKDQAAVRRLVAQTGALRRSLG
jgi:phosphoenolpyruvate carboxylase